MNYIVAGIAFLVGIFAGVLVLAWLTVIPGSSLTPMVILYSAGTIIALCAVGLTLYQAKASRKHNELSVKPHLSLSNNISGQDSSISSEITNNGLGPAEIISYRFMLDNEDLDPSHINTPYTLAQSLFNSNLSTCSISCGGFEPGLLFPANKSKLIFKADLTISMATTLVDEWERIRGRLSIVIEYQSLYGEKFELQDVVS